MVRIASAEALLSTSAPKQEPGIRLLLVQVDSPATDMGTTDINADGNILVVIHYYFKGFYCLALTIHH